MFLSDIEIKMIFETNRKLNEEYIEKEIIKFINNKFNKEFLINNLTEVFNFIEENNIKLNLIGDFDEFEKITSIGIDII